MKLARLAHDPAAVLGFFEEGLQALGALCERSWHDRLQVVAEGAAAKLWRTDGALVEAEIHFPPVDNTAPREADREVFPGCPLTFHLAEALRPSTLPLERVCLQAFDQTKPPALDVAEKLWHAQIPGTVRWKLEKPLIASWHFSLLVLARCEIQAIDQHWSLHRLALALPDGRRDEPLAGSLDFAQAREHPPEGLAWPAPDPARWQQLIRAALEEELAAELAAIRLRQQNYLRRDLERIDSYFESYERELKERQNRQRLTDARIKTEERLAAARTERERRRLDQVQRHEIRIRPHFDALALLAEPAWEAAVAFLCKNEPQTRLATFVPRARRWVVPGMNLKTAVNHS